MKLEEFDEVQWRRLSEILKMVALPNETRVETLKRVTSSPLNGKNWLRDFVDKFARNRR